MLVVIQRVKKAKVKIEEKTVSEIGNGLVILLGIKNSDTEEEVKCLTEKIVNLRIFEDLQNKMNLSILDIDGEILVVSQFTLYGDCRKGRRPGFDLVAQHNFAKKLYEQFILMLKEKKIKLKQGCFGEKMLVEIYNDGPVTFVIEALNGKIVI